MKQLSSEEAAITLALTHTFVPPGSPTQPQMTTSKRLSEKKVAKFEKKIARRGSVYETAAKKGSGHPVGPILLGFVVFVVVGTSLFLIIRSATGKGSS